MRKVKIIFGLLVVGMIVVVVAQNLDFFLRRHAIGVDIGLVSYHTPDFSTAIYLMFFFFTGLMIAFLMGLSERFRSGKAIRNLTEALDAEKKKVAELDAKLTSAQSRLTQNPHEKPENQSGAAVS
ncbi:MAG: hypothetical protein MUE70_00480 [Desulfobacterales bacterium]|jgi:hypothetical protein|nr:hypothetical protein [Desulfobacterales bacterium]